MSGPPRPAMVTWMRQVSHVPGQSWCAYAVFSDPGGFDGPGHAARRRGPLVKPRRGHPAMRISRLHSHGLGTRCLRFAAGVAPGPRKTRFRPPASSTEREWLPAGLL